jgi:sugar phosphate isomerase/epimerase
MIRRRDLLAAAACGSAALLASANGTAKLTMLSAMAGADVETSARRHAELGLRWLDLKDGLFGQSIDTLSLDNARRLAAIARHHGLGIASFSTALCATDLSVGEAAFRQRHGATLDHVLRLVDILQPRSIRLISAVLQPFPGPEAVMDAVEQRHPWVFAAYADMVDRIAAAGCQALIENEPNHMILARPEGILRFFARLDRPRTARYTWDVQNLWQVGIFPSLEVYRQLKPLIGCIHLKGGRSELPGGPLVHASALADASWPVLDIVRAAVADGVVPFLCLNPSHGSKPPGFDIWQTAQRDIAFLREHISADL